MVPVRPSPGHIHQRFSVVPSARGGVDDANPDEQGSHQPLVGLPEQVVPFIADLHEAGDGVSHVLECLGGDDVHVRPLVGEHHSVDGRLVGHGGVVA